MKTACIALKQFLFAGVVLAVGQLFKTTKIHAGELEARGLARPATAEELQEQAGIDPHEETGEPKQGGDPAAGSPPDSEPNDTPDEPEQEDEPDTDSGDAEPSEEPSAPVPKRRGRK